jgi:ABC-2 type transport system ATP-binding protein
MTSAHHPALRAESLSKNYVTDWSGHRWRALDRVSFAVPRGTVCGLVGPNGSGKTTTLKLFAGLTTPTAGLCEVAGLPVGRAVRERRIGFAPESPAFPGFLAADDYLEQTARVAGFARTAAQEAAAAGLALTGLAEAGRRRIGGFSKGMRQRLAIAQAVLTDPEVVLLDEPAAGLDPRAVEQLADIIRRLRGSGRTVLLSSHFLPQVEELCDQVVLLEKGRVLFAGKAGEVAAAGGLTRLYTERCIT